MARERHRKTLSYSKPTGVNLNEMIKNSDRYNLYFDKVKPDRRGPHRVGAERRKHPRYESDDLIIGKDYQVVMPKTMPVHYALFKRALDIVGASMAMLVLFPFLVIVAGLIKMDGGPILFVQERVGLGGKKFKMFKFRSMRVHADSEKVALLPLNEVKGPVFKIKNDPRITRFGKFIRKYSIDELPQLMNVIRGEMSLVGPRPALEAEVVKYTRWQVVRLAVKPGLTCIWQTSGRSNIKFDEWMRMDIRYLNKLSASHDLKIMFKTVKVVIKGDGAY